MTQDIDEEVVEMCDLSQGIWDKALAAGLSKGRQEGRQEGEARGEARGRQEGEERGRREGRQEGEARGISTSIRNLMDTMNLTKEQAMNALKVPESERAKYADML